MRTRVAMPCARVRWPRVLVCDEPFSGLDPISALRIERLLVDLNESGLTLLAVSHDAASTQRMADRVLALLPGQCEQGAPAQLLEHGDPRVRALLGEAIDPALVAAEEEH